MSGFNKSWLRPLYNDIHTACFEASLIMKHFEWKFDRILGVSRGGMLPALILSHMLDDLPVTPVCYSSKAGKGDDKRHENILPPIDKGSVVLLVDDICDSGHTMDEIKNYYERNGSSVYTFALYYKKRTPPVHVPDFKWRTIPEDAGWVIFPYEVNDRWNTINDEDLNAPNVNNNKVVAFPSVGRVDLEL